MIGMFSRPMYSQIVNSVQVEKRVNAHVGAGCEVCPVQAIADWIIAGLLNDVFDVESGNGTPAGRPSACARTNDSTPPEPLTMHSDGREVGTGTLPR